MNNYNFTNFEQELYNRLMRDFRATGGASDGKYEQERISESIANPEVLKKVLMFDILAINDKIEKANTVYKVFNNGITEEYTGNDIDTICEIIGSELTDDDIDDYIDDTCDDVCVFGIYFNPSHVLKELDPIAYSCTRDDIIDSMSDNWIDDIESLEVGQTTDIHGVTIERIHWIDLR